MKDRARARTKARNYQCFGGRCLVEGLVMLWHRARARAGARAVSEGDAL